MEKNNQAYEETYRRNVVRAGRATNLIAIPLCFIPAIVLAVVYKAMPSLNDILTGWLYIASIYGIYSIVEPISYFPVLGTAGTYMSFLAGNIGNMRLPCSAIAQEAVGVEPGTKKAELVSTIGICGSIITNIIIVAIAAIGGAVIFNAMPLGVRAAFKFVSTAIFAATFTMYALKKPILGLYAIVLGMILLNFLAFIPTFVMIPLVVFSTVALGFWMDDHKKTA